MVRLDEVSASTKILANRRQRNSFEALWHTSLESFERVVAVGPSIALGCPPVGFDGVRLAVILGQEQAVVACARDRLFQERYLGADVGLRRDAVPRAAQEHPFGGADVDVFVWALYPRAMRSDVDATLQKNLLDALGLARFFRAGFEDHRLVAAVRELARTHDCFSATGVQVHVRGASGANAAWLVDWSKVNEAIAFGCNSANATKTSSFTWLTTCSDVQ
ncbi:hypothetical protein SPRG_21071 [Saprolegnia parasitica CBS 223.65]|uniref:Uncharacterized protein n=1 Tax=Saprolegnia parasitica (strain CBS 223.65) TaxID=695850 RepID=A0A067C1Y3_SAPPC|nr:hypothetical protein SPRG_21071 [Saprolegnia parasitica CBS 223.65]KDO23130.1 hypothetical protein SPRG_21071 [Saprolegnia parasitica CBS 223.65]|eukprot:XP_012206246.1 hypothetical protein SPRG_21071 [Saprolegnia parasitica CBS 223.65]